MNIYCNEEVGWIRFKAESEEDDKILRWMNEKMFRASYTWVFNPDDKHVRIYLDEIKDGEKKLEGALKTDLKTTRLTILNILSIGLGWKRREKKTEPEKIAGMIEEKDEKEVEE